MAKKNIYEDMNLGDMSYLLDDSADVGVQKSNNETLMPLECLIPFKEHPFHVDTDEESFQQLVDSIKENGLIYPILVRPMGEKYEIIAGHRRVAACREAGVPEVPAVVRAMDDFDATILMVHSNFYREKILISEKAKAYRMCMDAEKHQGKKGTDTAAVIGKDHDSKRQVYRFIRLSYLSDDFLGLLDNGKIPMNIGVELSYLSTEAQEILWNVMQEYGLYPSAEQAGALRKLYGDTGGITYQDIVVIMTETLKKPKSNNNISFKRKDLQEYFEDDTDAEYMAAVIRVLLSKYHNGEFDGIIDESEFESGQFQ